MISLNTTVKLAGLILLPLLTLGGALAGLAALTPATTPVPSPIAITLGQSRAADLALNSSPPDLEAAILASQLALSQTPYDSSSRLRLAYIDSLDGKLSAEGVAHLERSYALLPLDQYVSIWRVGFALNHWGDLNPDLRRKVEIETFAVLGTRRSGQMLATLESVTSPTGIVPAIFWRQRFKRSPRP